MLDLKADLAFVKESSTWEIAKLIIAHSRLRALQAINFDADVYEIATSKDLMAG